MAFHAVISCTVSSLFSTVIVGRHQGKWLRSPTRWKETGVGWGIRSCFSVRRSGSWNRTIGFHQFLRWAWRKVKIATRPMGWEGGWVWLFWVNLPSYEADVGNFNSHTSFIASLSSYILIDNTTRFLFCILTQWSNLFDSHFLLISSRVAVGHWVSIGPTFVVFILWVGAWLREIERQQVRDPCSLERTWFNLPIPVPFESWFCSSSWQQKEFVSFIVFIKKEQRWNIVSVIKCHLLIKSVIGNSWLGKGHRGWDI